MNNELFYLQVQTRLDELAEALLQAGLYAEQAPDAAAFASTAPFCCDTMSFPNWLQFVLLPKLGEMVKTRAALPHNLVLLPMLEMTVPASSQTARLYAAIAELDSLFQV
ncbi:YqcC family protein [Pseudoalteromonas fenneropenaei]|uniref:YqcC family protein n=1 Tax=Pseudoalteromonas fenneropenaei TaxID=1737459 RepID=A0ABV7CGB8_9GAMM